MSENEERTFRIVFNFYRKWRDVIIEKDEQWVEFAREAGEMGIALDFEHNPLGARLMDAVMMAINDLYKNGMKPMPAGYFGRDDI